MKPIVRALLAFAVGLVRSRVSLAGGDPPVAASVGGLSPIDPAAPGAPLRPDLLVMACAALGALAGGPGLRAAGDRARLAAHTIPHALGPAQPGGTGPAGDQPGIPRPDPADLHYYHRWRTHLSLAMDCPEARPVQPLQQAKVIEVPEVGGLHHHNERVAAWSPGMGCLGESHHIGFRQRQVPPV